MKIETATIRRLRDALLQSGRRPSSVLSPSYETLTRLGMLSAQEAAALDRVDPLAETMYLMMSADGRITEEERDAVRGAIRGLTGDVLNAGTIQVMLEKYAERAQQMGRNQRLQEVGKAVANSPTEAEGAFALAAAVALADDQVAPEETALMNALARWFRISEERAAEILDQLDEDRHSVR
ncbi:MAG TPA: TerB family tellurite resistance protein [Polyangiaceae bacterium]|jgi:tellurite resistance protein